MLQPGSRIQGDDMAHLASILFFFGLLTGLLVLLERIVRDNGPAIRQALAGPSGSRAAAVSNEGALDLVGSCLRASFPSLDREALGPDLGRLLRQLTEAPARPRHA